MNEVEVQRPDVQLGDLLVGGSAVTAR